MKRFSIAFAVLLVSSNAISYPTTTHSAMTNYAVSNSHLSPARGAIGLRQLDLLEWFGKNPTAPFKDGSAGDLYEYVSLAGTPVYMAGDLVFEKTIINLTRNGFPEVPLEQSINGLVVRGVIREDDNKNEFPDTDEPGGVFPRVYAHFFDPFFSRGLTIASKQLGSSAMDWALTSDGDVWDVPDTWTVHRSNNFHMGRLKEAMWRALTGQTSEGMDATPNGSGVIPLKSETVRKKYWASVFRLIGNQVHLLQDMGQPQHTRNDPHAGMGCFMGSCAAGHDSFYEKYIHARTINEREYVLNENEVDRKPVEIKNRTRPNLGGYDLPLDNFHRYSDFYTSGTDNATGKGLANYSNRGFYSAGTNVGRSDYPLPDFSALVPKIYSTPVDHWYGTTNATYVMYAGNVPDFAGPGSQAAHLTAAGSIDQFMPNAFNSSKSLNAHIYDDMAALLVPRATGYSTAFINFMFRGRMQISLPKEGAFAVIDHANASVYNPFTDQVGFNYLKIGLSAPPTDNNGQQQALYKGRLKAVLKYRRNFCFDNELKQLPTTREEAAACVSPEQEITVSDFVNAGAQIALSTVPQSFSFHFPRALPVNATNVRLQVIYRGSVSSEADEIVVATANISEPTYFSYMNATDYWKIDGKVYTPQQIAADQSLIDKLSVCVRLENGVRSLVDNCLKPSNLDMTFFIGPEDQPITLQVEQLEVKKHIRIAMLGLLDVPINIRQPESSPCIPRDTIPAPTYGWEDSWDVEESVQGEQTVVTTINLNTFSSLSKIRGLPQWNWSACVQSGTANPIAADDRTTVFSALNDVSTFADPIKINNGEGFR